ncbi:chromate transporter [Enterococcus raffinosus]|uniref:chromate transporter n=1 Tax=Enterococcus raffinosus TaxID=71452 RepID=UPI003AC24316
MQLFWTFLKIGLFSIGGGYAIIPLIQEQVVHQQGWLSDKVFTDIITISQMTPGPLAVNTSTFVGMQIDGVLGAILATIGCILGGCVISISLYQFFQKHQESLYVSVALKSLKASSVGFTILLLTFFESSELSRNMARTYRLVSGISIRCVIDHSTKIQTEPHPTDVFGWLHRISYLLDLKRSSSNENDLFNLFPYESNISCFCSCSQYSNAVDVRR